MIRISELMMNIEHSRDDLIKKISSLLEVDTEDIEEYKIARKSIDARKKPDIFYSYTVDVSLKYSPKKESLLLQKYKKNIHISKTRIYPYLLPKCAGERLSLRPVIVGAGPAGIFAALSLARRGFSPLVLERGEDVDKRSIRVEHFWKTGELSPESNVSFGEGGAGTFSDGKLNTMVKDKIGRNTEVLKTFVHFGADSEILYLQKPHIGTDKLKNVIKNIREEIIRLGGEFRFNTALEDISFHSSTDGAKITYKLLLSDKTELETHVLVLALGHSARDTFQMLYKRKIPMEAKSFAVGLRIQHPQSMIDLSQFGKKYAQYLSPASYKLSAQVEGRGVYSFCMCPGGYVVDASTEDKMMTVNGMSYHARESRVANSAIIVTVSPSDFSAPSLSSDIISKEVHPLAGVEFQRELERNAYQAGGGAVPIQLLSDFLNGKTSRHYGDVEPRFKGRVNFAPLHQIFPDYILYSIANALPLFDRKIKGFARADAILAGVESRTSSPVRILRDKNMESSYRGIYPCGEGAGYAGGITSAAMDGLKVAEQIISSYTPYL